MTLIVKFLNTLYNFILQSLMERRSELTSVLPSEPTPPHLVSTWADLQGPATAEVVAEIVIEEIDTGQTVVDYCNLKFG